MASSRIGWFNEPVRHSLAAKGIKTGRGYFAKGNRDPGYIKALYAWGVKKSDLGLPYAKRPSRYSPEMAFALANNSRTNISGMPANFSRMNVPSVADEFAAPTLPPLQEPQQMELSPPIMTSSPTTSAPVMDDMEETPQMQQSEPSDEELLRKFRREVRADEMEEMPVEEKGSDMVIGAVKRAADSTIPSRMQKTDISTPGVPPETRSLQDESFEVTI